MPSIAPPVEPQPTSSFGYFRADLKIQVLPACPNCGEAHPASYVQSPSRNLFTDVVNCLMCNTELPLLPAQITMDNLPNSMLKLVKTPELLLAKLMLAIGAALSKVASFFR